MNSKLRAATLLALAGAAALAGGQVLAGGVPASDALHYSGTLEDASGKPLVGEHYIELKLWHDAKSDADPADCATKSEKQTLVSGHFSVQLPAACRDAVSRSPDVFIDTAYTDVVATKYNYGCNDDQRAYDEVMSAGFPGYYTAYCCCYAER